MYFEPPHSAAKKAEEEPLPDPDGIRRRLRVRIYHLAMSSTAGRAVHGYWDGTLRPALGRLRMRRVRRRPDRGAVATKSATNRPGLARRGVEATRRVVWLAPPHRAIQIERSARSLYRRLVPGAGPLPEDGSGQRTNYLRMRQALMRQASGEHHAAGPLSAESHSAMLELEHGTVPPDFSQVWPTRILPPRDMAFATVCNDLYLPALEVLVASLLDVYPQLACEVVVFHDGTIDRFSQRRLQGLYEWIRFVEPDMSWLDRLPTDSSNRRRIGVLGYMSIMALGLRGYSRVVVLDSDTAVIDDISALWTGRDHPLGSVRPLPEPDPDALLVCRDHGARPWAGRSPALDRPVLNSGMISLPGRMLTDANLAALQDLARRNHEPFCPLLDRFADQKAWNRFLWPLGPEQLPVNFNCNIRFLDRSRGGDTSFVRLVHFTGDKPWFHRDYMDPALIPPGGGERAPRAAIWRGIAHGALGRLRQRRYQQEIAQPGYFAPQQARPEPPPGDARPDCMMIGNGPSLARTDLGELAGIETFAFNWFVLHPDYDQVRPDHLVLGSHMLFGGWQTRRPKLPEAFVDALKGWSWRPVIWTSFYFREHLQELGLTEAFDIRYVLFEKPHKVFFDVAGHAPLDVDGQLGDGRTGVLSVALPVALRMGFRRIGLVGCDSNYNLPGASSGGRKGNYFYDPALHVSRETAVESLTAVWAEDGPGLFAYERAQAYLADLGGGFVDYTLEGRLPLPKGRFADLRPPPRRHGTHGGQNASTRPLQDRSGT
jgi:hypothetical protein